MPRQGYLTPVKPGTRNAQRGEAFLPDILNPGTQTPQGLHQDADGALAHTRRTGQDTDARSDTEVSRKEAHGSAGSSDIHRIRRMIEGTDHDMRIVAIAQVVRTGRSAGQGVKNEDAVADALRGRQLDVSLQGCGSVENILHFSNQRLVIR